MTRHIRTLPILLVVLIALIILACNSSNTQAQAQQIEWADLELFIEFNSTDEDLGIQLELDGEAWNRLTVIDPNGQTILDITAQGSMGMQGLTELFFESSEPPLVEQSRAEFEALFPAGEYQFFGETIDGDMLVGTATLTHNIPDGPEITEPEEDEVGVDPNDTVIEWNPVTTPAGINIVEYQIIIESDALAFEVFVSGDVTTVTIPAEFMSPGTEYEVEVLAIEEGGNQTISSVAFETE